MNLRQAHKLTFLKTSPWGRGVGWWWWGVAKEIAEQLRELVALPERIWVKPTWQLTMSVTPILGISLDSLVWSQ